MEESDEISDPQIFKVKQKKTHLMKNVLSKISQHIKNACEVIRCFLEIKPISGFISSYKLENQLTDVMLTQKTKQTKISLFYQQISNIIFNYLKCEGK